MSLLRTVAAVALAWTLDIGVATAQPAVAPANPYEPQSGQEGKDVVWVPTHQALVDKMLDMAQLRADDYLIDLGSGDGRTVISAARRGVRALGIEYNPDLVALATRNAEREGVADKASFVRGDIFATDFSGATVLTLFLLPDLNVKLRPAILRMKPGTRVVSNSFNMGEWTPDETVQVEGECRNFCRAHRWVVPAQVAGSWRLADGTLLLQQSYQLLAGILKRDGTDVSITGARMTGTQIVFTAAGRRYTGHVDGERMELSAEGEGGPWVATRTNP